MKNLQYELDKVKRLYKNNSRKISLVGTVFALFIFFTTINFITHNSQTLINHAAPPETPSFTQYSSTNNKTQIIEKESQSLTDITKLEKYLTVEAALLGISDNISLYFEDLNQNKEITFDPTRSWIPASTIKAYVALEAFRQRRVGLIDFNQTVTIKAQNVVPTELETAEFPVLQEGTQATIKQLVEAMIIQSDNTAYNTLLDILDRRSINATLQSLGFTETVVGEKLNLDDEQFQQDLSEPGRQPNTTTVKDLAYLFELLYNKQIPDSEEILAIFKRQKINTMLPALIPASTEVAHKTGDWAPIYHDGGIIYKKDNPFVFVVFSNSNDPSIIAKLTHVAYYQNAESVGQDPSRDTAILPVSHFIASASLTTEATNKEVLGTNISITSSQRYIVQEGDSLYIVAKKFYGDGNLWQEIARRNYLSSPTAINPGQTIIIPSVTILPKDSTRLSPEITAADLGITSTDLTINKVDASNVTDALLIPSSYFYPVKYYLEESRIVFSNTPTDKINAYLAFAESRLSEIKTMLSQGNTIYVETLLNESENALSEAVSLAKSNKISQEEYIKIKQLNDLYFAVLADNMSHISPKNKEAMIDIIYNFYQKDQPSVSSILKASIQNNPIQQEPIIGTVSKVNNNVITIKFDNGQTNDIAINTTTSIRDFHNKLPDKNKQIKVGEKIAIIGDITENKIFPRFILHDIPKELPDKHEGTILRIFPQKGQLEILNNDGKKEEIHINSDTILQSKDTSVSLEGITPGSQITVFGEEQTTNGGQNINLFAPTQIPASSTNSTISNKENGKQKTENTTHSQANSNNNGASTRTVINATAVTVTQNGSGVNTQVVTQAPSNQTVPTSNTAGSKNDDKNSSKDANKNKN